MNRPLPPRLRRIMAILLVCGVLLFPGCAREEMSKELDFQFALPNSWKIVTVARLDTDEDNENEWVLLYTFDDPGNKAFTPVRCAVYHIVRREPKLPVIYPYHLQAPGWTYLGEGADRTTVQIGNVVTRIQLDPQQVFAATNEVIVQSTDADGFVNRAAIFQWRDNVQNKLIDPEEILIVPRDPLAKGQWYQCVGLFEGTLQVQIETDQVKVWDRTNDRSQFVRVNTYEPTTGSSGYLDENQKLIPPVSSCVDFAFEVPQDVAQSPYPEKIVMAFQKKFTIEPDYGSSFLTDNAKQKRALGGAWRMFGPSMRSSVENVCVTQVSYDPDTATKAEIKAFEMDTDMQASGQGTPPITTRVETIAEYKVAGQPTQQIGFVWQLINENNVWKIDDVFEAR